MAYYYSPFRKKYTKRKSDTKCDFCEPKVWKRQSVKCPDGTMVENDHYVWLVNFFPKFEGHTMLVPKKHTTQIGEETPEAVIAREQLLKVASEALKKVYSDAGIEFFLQTGEGSQSTISHLHWHVVPALPNDKIRGFEKLGHFYTLEASEEKMLLFPIEIRLAKEKLVKALSSEL